MGYESENFDELVSTFAKVSSTLTSMKLGTGVSTINILYDFNCDT
jgi:hypothetical protein